jgi:xanthine dehydrogenase YagS FAD-binding subunit
MNKFEYAKPGSINEVFQYFDEPGAVIKAGGIDLLDLMKENIIAPTRLVNIKDLPELNYIRENEDGSFSIGPAVTLTELSENEIIRKNFKSLSDAAGKIATPQVRNSATLGGNLCQRPRCWYFRSIDFDCSRKEGSHCFALFGENKYHAVLGAQSGCAIVHPSGTAVPLMALNAGLIISDGSNQKSISMNDFYVSPDEDITRETVLKPNELITEIVIPKEAREYKSEYIKLMEKQSFDWPLADVAVALKMKGNNCEKASVILGSAAPVPWKSVEAETVLSGKSITKELAREAGEASMQEAYPLQENKYKINLFKTIVFRAVCQAAGIEAYS